MYNIFLLKKSYSIFIIENFVLAEEISFYYIEYFTFGHVDNLL